MGKIRIILAASILLMPGQVGAALVDRGGGLIYDDVLNLTWLQDSSGLGGAGKQLNTKPVLNMQPRHSAGVFVPYVK
jgi:hypothetical protein